MNKTKKLLFSVTKKDLKITYYKASGKGGQNRNKRETAVRIQHKDSGVMVTASEQRNRSQNLKMAFNRLTTHKDFLKWIRVESARKSQNLKEVEREIQRWVDDAMHEKNLKIEYLNKN